MIKPSALILSLLILVVSGTAQARDLYKDKNPSTYNPRTSISAYDQSDSPYNPQRSNTSDAYKTNSDGSYSVNGSTSTRYQINNNGLIINKDE